MGGGRIVEAMVEDFKSQGYEVTYHLVNAKNYGVPQDRERVFIIGVRLDIANEYKFKYELPHPTHGEGTDRQKPYVTLKDAIGHLKSSEIGEVYESSFSSRFLSRNRKRRWDEVSFTIQASGRHAPLHPSGEPMIKLGKDEWVLPETSEHRRLSAVEVALIQTFPANYVWKGSLGAIYKQVGNAVPCLLAKAVSQPLADFLSSYYQSVNPASIEGSKTEKVEIDTEARIVRKKRIKKYKKRLPKYKRRQYGKKTFAVTPTNQKIKVGKVTNKVKEMVAI
ncbi:hypothetical protein ShirakiTB12_54250 [Priestia megaterium]|uniref:DNA (cytosine-5-)-methyltransferase n=2 Tax=Priestia megaterium TaxID=1404 RepID=A0AAX6BT20_PRIMG|nr:hypothetical protein ShirakiTB12_54250 [Priestia megaterium]